MVTEGPVNTKHSKQGSSQHVIIHSDHDHFLLISQRHIFQFWGTVMDASVYILSALTVKRNPPFFANLSRF